MLTGIHIQKLVYKYIEVHSGYLGDFSYKTHAEFYPLYCDLDIDPYEYEGTTKERFISILKSSNASTQAKIIRGIFEKYPLSYFEQKNYTKEEIEEKRKIYEEFQDVIKDLENEVYLQPLDLKQYNDLVERALDEAETLIKEHDATSALDRTHTAMHGYLKEICKNANLQCKKHDSITNLFKLIKNEHPVFLNELEKDEYVKAIINSISNVLDKLNTIRNRSSLAHPNEKLLKPEEAMFVVNISRAVLYYVKTKSDGSS
ncbi:HEPN domain-containing protein [Laceyella sediminis]|uniref:HEPN domain-containing protein n=1 Tax=Laceyella sediminis TaxID=573074 RepID=A0ABX5ERE0_9BACL|nr:abortive infection family protein [Laceyella sediminis]PRZ16304.1 HEPN domain-containing protein [Laceyella sediminis]